jgi:hypothetical protein
VVDWATGRLTACGLGAGIEGQGRVAALDTALKASLEDAQQRLAAAVGGVQVTADQTLERAAAREPTGRLRRGIREVVADAAPRLVAVKGGGVVETCLSVDLYGPGSLGGAFPGSGAPEAAAGDAPLVLLRLEEGEAPPLPVLWPSLWAAGKDGKEELVTDLASLAKEGRLPAGFAVRRTGAPGTAPSGDTPALTLPVRPRANGADLVATRSILPAEVALLARTGRIVIQAAGR